MNQKDIHVGHTYANRGKGKTTRRVLRIGFDVNFAWLSTRSERPSGPGVVYEDSRGRPGVLYLASFASWAGSDVTPGVDKEETR